MTCDVRFLVTCGYCYFLSGCAGRSKTSPGTWTLATLALLARGRCKTSPGAHALVVVLIGGECEQELAGAS